METVNIALQDFLIFLKNDQSRNFPCIINIQRRSIKMNPKYGCVMKKYISKYTKWKDLRHIRFVVATFMKLRTKQRKLNVSCF